MDFQLSAEQSARRDRVLRQVAEAFPAGRPPGFAREDWRTMGELGLLGTCLPAEYGGGGLGALDTALVIEAFGRACTDTGLVFAASAHQFACSVPVAAYGTDAVRKGRLPDLVSGAAVAGNAMTEPESGSDVSRLRVTARQVPGGWVLDGTKSFVSNGPVCDLLVTYATSDPDLGHLGQTAFLVDASAPGVRRSGPFDKMGLWSCRAGSVDFEECFVPDEQVLGRPGAGAAVFQASMGWERACLFAGYVGLLDRLVERCVRFARERRQSGRPIGSFQAVSHRIVDMRLRLEGARLLLYRACAEMDRGERAVLPVALAKLAVSEAAVAGALDAVRVFGGRGYLADDGIEAMLRDSVPAVLFSGTSEMQKEIAARELGL
ncbi:acyl-CoA dehydrogenase family protein [Streptomyces sp. SHP 1-2]|uniref:acyl-CoA dehydrogenase family protein n=1 Tax=Streptomyces sp. SHP 1-2 TaxID=2769489 RepID=UPI0022377715|nr:acyl-CoA dehydrogenase family protein [Streptomyces sp. SHP 1-2]MCW5251423.1 acyl-CoA/acyl-ACP dehydrogenase [Streptomyces sp. SHP 1-2]